MAGRRLGGLWAVLGWVAFPVVPVVLESLYSNPFNADSLPVDPREWGWETWLIQLGPLLGFGYLAGATLGLPDEPAGRRWLGSLRARRSVWVAVGPWSGFLAWAAVFLTAWWVLSKLPRGDAGSTNAAGQGQGWENSWTLWALSWAFSAMLYVTFAYGWLAFAYAALRRARRLGRARRCVCRGLAVAVAYVGSLFGSFWAATEFWRGYFFDPRIVPILLAALGVGLMSGCGQTITYGEVRRRELFHAMLLAWTLGLALLWRWWARSRPKEE
jgi:hypothetical protein